MKVKRERCTFPYSLHWQSTSIAAETLLISFRSDRREIHKIGWQWMTTAYANDSFAILWEACCLGSQIVQTIQFESKSGRWQAWNCKRQFVASIRNDNICFCYSSNFAFQWFIWSAFICFCWLVLVIEYEAFQFRHFTFAVDIFFLSSSISLVAHMCDDISHTYE